MPTLSTATLVSAASNQLRLARTGGIQRVKRTLAIIEHQGGPEAISVLAETWARHLIAVKGFVVIDDGRADRQIIAVANEYLATLMTDPEAARQIIVTHDEPLYLASVLLIANCG